MNRRAWMCIAVVCALVLVVAMGASAQAKQSTAAARGQKLGLVFNVTNILLDIQEASDGVSAGLGMKYWLADKMALRGVLDFNYTSNSVTTSSNFGLSGAFEYHLIKAKVSPYVGGLVGIHVIGATGTPLDFGFFVGGVLGAEVAVLDYLGLFAEYNLRLNMNEPSFGVDLGLGNNAQIGLIIYLP
jgi:hypothetical protein